ncbi:MAG TPA: hypothetical protein VJ550_04045 [Geomonas sp.]|nr:hypothetical protein [Geomonas sp.]
MRVVLMVAAALLVSVNAWATPYWLFNVGGNGTADQTSIGVELGSTDLLAKRFPLAAELSMNFDFEDPPDDTFFNNNKYTEPYTVHTSHYGPEFGYLFKSGVNLDDWVKNLTLQAGVGFSMQSTVQVGTGLWTGRHWEQGDREVEFNPMGYGGLLYRINRLALSLGYNNRRGVVGGIGSSW